MMSGQRIGDGEGVYVSTFLQLAWIISCEMVLKGEARVVPPAWTGFTHPREVKPRT